MPVTAPPSLASDCAHIYIAAGVGCLRVWPQRSPTHLGQQPTTTPNIQHVESAQRHVAWLRGQARLHAAGVRQRRAGHGAAAATMHLRMNCTRTGFMRCNGPVPALLFGSHHALPCRRPQQQRRQARKACARTWIALQISAPRARPPSCSAVARSHRSCATMLLAARADAWRRFPVWRHRHDMSANASAEQNSAIGARRGCCTASTGSGAVMYVSIHYMAQHGGGDTIGHRHTLAR